MTSKQIMLILSAWTLLAAGVLPGCQAPKRQPLTVSPYETRQVFAVAPLRNESGTRYADPVALADKLTQQLALARGVDTLPVNRVLAAMQALSLDRVDNKADALRLRQVLGVDGLVLGSLTAYDPYDPPKLGLNLELYFGSRAMEPAGADRLDTRGLSAAASDQPAPRGGDSPDSAPQATQPVTAIAGYFDASDPYVLDLVDAYVAERGPDVSGEMTRRRHLISIDLYSEFVSHRLVAQLLDAERLRLRQPNSTNTINPQATPGTTRSPRSSNVGPTPPPAPTPSTYP